VVDKLNEVGGPEGEIAPSLDVDRDGHLTPLDALLVANFLNTSTTAPAPDDTHPWQNPANALDVNDDGLVTALDELLVVNELNQRNVSAADGQITAIRTPRADNRPYFDVNGDQRVTAQDVDQLIAYLNAPQRSATITNADELLADGQFDAVLGVIAADTAGARLW
jgi:hypothetical protein